MSAIPLTTLQVDIPDPPKPEVIYVTTVFPVWGWAIAGALIALAIIATGIVRYRRHEELTTQRRSDNDRRAAESKNAGHWQCGICGSPQVVRKPELSL